MAGSRRAFALFDRDGTLMEDRGFLSDPGRRCFGGRGLCACSGGSVSAFLVVTNQSDRPRIFHFSTTKNGPRGWTSFKLKESGVSLDGTPMCPRVLEERCAFLCRKPRGVDGALWKGRRGSGDSILEDRIVVMITGHAAGNEIGCRSILVRPVTAGRRKGCPLKLDSPRKMSSWRPLAGGSGSRKGRGSNGSPDWRIR